MIYSPRHIIPISILSFTCELFLYVLTVKNVFFPSNHEETWKAGLVKIDNRLNHRLPNLFLAARA